MLLNIGEVSTSESPEAQLTQAEVEVEVLVDVEVDVEFDAIIINAAAVTLP